MRMSVTGISARNKAIAGMSKISKQVKESIGSFGLNHASEKENKISNDGVFIATSLCRTLPDEFERRGALIVEENIKKINDEVGDFSSTAWALTEAIVKESLRYLPNEKTVKAQKNYSEIAQMIETSKIEVLTLLKEMVVPIESKEQLIKAAFISAEDEKMAELLGSMQWDLGIEGRIIAEESNNQECSIEKVEGILLDNGFVSSNLVTNAENATLEINSPLPIILTNYVIGEPEMKILRENIFKNLATQKKTGCILMARAFTKEAIQETQENMKSFAVILLNAPYTDQTEVMRDIQAVVGGRYVDSEEGRLEDIYITDVGYTKRIVARQWKSQISGMHDDKYKERVDARVELLKKKVIGSESDFEKRMLNERIAQLTGGFAILKVGSKALDDRRRLQDKADDAVNTVRNALREGTVRGAGIALKEISDKLNEENILKRPIRCIYDQIIDSAPEGYEVPEWVVDSYYGLRIVIDRVCAFVPTFISINSIDCEKDKPECNCGNKSE